MIHQTAHGCRDSLRGMVIARVICVSEGVVRCVPFSMLACLMPEQQSKPYQQLCYYEDSRVSLGLAGSHFPARREWRQEPIIV